MKKVYSTVMMLALMVAALSFTACGGDDDEVDNGSGDVSIVGEWECTNLDFDKNLSGLYVESRINIGDRVRFQSDGTIYARFNDGEFMGLKCLNGMDSPYFISLSTIVNFTNLNPDT